MAARRRVPMGPWAAAPPLLPRTHPGLCTRAGPRDPYEVLGVRPDASPAEIRAAFLARCKEVHPDGDPADPSRHRRFLRLAAAYRALRPPRGDPPTHGTPPPCRGPPPRSRTPPPR
ncbi:dnaJ homolog subfamily C member 4 [Athene noctua]|uniref:dnaJ homolog subfamily C member 4 n=1 Tax=Athene noctua TaxID=126797 RepID=UPI003EBFD950